FISGTGDPAHVQRFLAQVPLRLAIDAGTAIGSAYRDDGESLIAVALQVRGERSVVAAEVSLGEIEQRMRQLAGDDVARVVDGLGEVLAGSTTTPLSAAERDLVAAAAAGRPVSRVVAGAKGTRWLASAAAVPRRRDPPLERGAAGPRRPGHARAADRARPDPAHAAARSPGFARRRHRSRAEQSVDRGDGAAHPPPLGPAAGLSAGGDDPAG